jgi:hypothetical protein
MPEHGTGQPDRGDGERERRAHGDRGGHGIGVVGR